MKVISIKSLDEISLAAKKFISMIGENKVFVFYGTMGAGKTTFIRAVCEELGVTDVINSPTFAIINEYNTKDGEQIFHFDFYRINKIEEAYDFGYEDYFYSQKLCFVEWPEKVAELIPSDAIEVHIEEIENGARKITIKD
ncbi:MAG: tRNA (adenosine(37)-N6)-threonylcarbamoyltransferase complex ATPase subunit type 1 TsaE [Paludibacteraceae bacterium]|nr:tRNA (adenosine(37)-N6)-threonylcarbamoyltransferase complex ATPase subunit type 1 TsaE [Paludibacteraceae bacterium]